MTTVPSGSRPSVATQSFDELGGPDSILAEQPLDHAVLPAPRAHAGAGRTIATGLLAGAAGVAVMTLAEKLEQRFTGRPNSMVPRRTLQALTGLPARTDRQRWLLNHAMHWGQGTALGVVRAAMSERGRRGLRPSLVFAVIRFSVDQTLENATGVGSPPPTWPRSELILDVTHKIVYACAAGVVADCLLRPAGS
ncbi:MAG TPA: hypothetical protein VMZ00_14125 [Sporichthya sp.]|nr:hypothetical protein [Sporichthya sp.]